MAECLTHGISTKRRCGLISGTNAQEAVAAFLYDQPRPASVRLHLVREEVLATA